MTTPDFQEVVQDLIIEGDYTTALLAHECGCTETYIRSLRDGKTKGNPGYVIGARLIELHKEMASG